MPGQRRWRELRDGRRIPGIPPSQKLHSLTYLELYNYQINDDDISSLQLLHTDGNLTHLTLSNEQYWYVALKEIRQQFQKG